MAEGQGEGPPPRYAELLLVTPDGAPAGRLPAFAVATPWWQDIEPVVSAARASHGVEVTVLRLLEAERDEPHGGKVTYLAEVDRPLVAPGWAGALVRDPLRQPWAEPRGPAADLAWAASALAARDMVPAGAPVQVRSWNLSSIWRIPTNLGTVWLKVVPPFFAHEGAVLASMPEAPVPRLLGHARGRVLLADIAGENLYEAGLAQRREMIDLLVALQVQWFGRLDRLAALGLPDWRGPSLTGLIADVLARTAPDLGAEDRHILEAFLRRLPRRLAAIAECGIADSLVHGDFHPGNMRGDGTNLTLLDWGDSGIGHPLLDQPAFLAMSTPPMWQSLRRHWTKAWRRRCPGSDPGRAARLLAPVAAARQAVIYRRFLDGIEPSEHPYHRADPARWLRRTAELLRAGRRLQSGRAVP